MPSRKLPRPPAPPPVPDAAPLDAAPPVVVTPAPEKVGEARDGLAARARAFARRTGGRVK